MNDKGLPATIKLGSQEFRVFDGLIVDTTERLHPDGKGVNVEITFRITHLEHFCIVCGRQGKVHLLGTFQSPIDGLEYPYAVCALHEPAQGIPED